MSTPFGAQVPSPTTTKLFNGPDKDKLDRLAIREICEGWPCHRDARNWRAVRARSLLRAPETTELTTVRRQYRSMFTDDAQVRPRFRPPLVPEQLIASWSTLPQVFTTWSVRSPAPERRLELTLLARSRRSAGKSIDDFISASIAGFNRGERIMHAAMGCSVELGADSKRAVGILKTCIDQRFELDGEKGGKVEVDAQCLNRFCFFCEKNEKGEWKVRLRSRAFAAAVLTFSLVLLGAGRLLQGAFRYRFRR